MIEVVLFAAAHMSLPVKVFGCRPLTEGAACMGGRRRKTSKGGNRGEGRRGWFVARYGDLSAANAARD
jgi:hypothetical protein